MLNKKSTKFKFSFFGIGNRTISFPETVNQKTRANWKLLRNFFSIFFKCLHERTSATKDLSTKFKKAKWRLFLILQDIIIFCYLFDTSLVVQSFFLFWNFLKDGVLCLLKYTQKNKNSILFSQFFVTC